VRSPIYIPQRGRAFSSLLFRYRVAGIACAWIILRGGREEKRFSFYMRFTLAVKWHKYKQMLTNGQSARAFYAVKMFPLRAACARSRRRKVKNCKYIFGIAPLLCNFASCRFSICPSCGVNVTSSRASKRLAYLPANLTPTMSVK